MELYGNGHNEEREELEKITKMSSYARLCYLRELARFHKTMHPEDKDSFFVDRVLLVTKGYEKR